MPRIEGISGPAEGTACDFTEEASIGRGPDNTLCVNDDALSRRHAVVKLVEDTLVLEDKESKNGTLYQNQRIQSVRLRDTDRFNAGRSVFLVMRDAPSRAEARTWLAAALVTLTAAAVLGLLWLSLRPGPRVMMPPDEDEAPAPKTPGASQPRGRAKPVPPPAPPTPPPARPRPAPAEPAAPESETRRTPPAPPEQPRSVPPAPPRPPGPATPAPRPARPEPAPPETSDPPASPAPPASTPSAPPGKLPPPPGLPVDE